LLSEAQFKQETNDNLLCPDRLESNDFRQYIESSAHFDSTLFNKLYKLDAKSNVYTLAIDFLELTSVEAVNALNADLSRLFEVFASVDDASFKQKYIKSIQQEEIEHIVKHADPSSIIWVNLTGSSGESSELNKLRYSHVLNLLQTKVLTHNYKQMYATEEEVRGSGGSQLLSRQSVSLNEFLVNAMKYLIESFIREMNKNYFASFAPKIDKQLAQEIYKHYGFYTYLRAIETTNSTNVSQAEGKFNAIVNEYMREASSRHPLLLCNNDSNDPHSYFDMFASKWMHGLIQANQQMKENQLTILYRFANHTILSSDLFTLVQSIAHQACYLLEVHESSAFNVNISVCQILLKP
jgi:hypothetical protein